MDNNIKNKLTDSAKEALNDISQEVIIRILEEAHRIAQMKETADKEISLSDILGAKEKILNERVRLEKSEYRRKRMSYLIGITGAMYAIIGLFIYVFQNKDFNISSDIGLIIAATGITFSFFGLFYQQFYSKLLLSRNVKEGQYDSDDFDLVKKWQVIEKLTRVLMIKNGIDENKSNSFNYIINYLDELVNDKNQSNKLRTLLKSRNLILHDNYKLEKGEKNDLLKFSSEIIDLLEENLKKHSTQHRV